MTEKYNIQYELTKLRKSLKTLQSTVKFYEAKEKQLSSVMCIEDDGERKKKYYQLYNIKPKNTHDKTIESYCFKQACLVNIYKYFDNDDFFVRFE